MTPSLSIWQDAEGRGVLTVVRSDQKRQDIAVFPTVDEAWRIAKGACREFDRLIAELPTSQLERLMGAFATTNQQHVAEPKATGETY